MQRAHREQRRNCGELAADPAVAQDQDVDFLVFDQAPRREAELLHGLREPLLAAGGAEEDGECADLEARQGEPAHLGELLVGEDRALQLEPPAVGGLRPQEVAFRAEPDLGGGDQLLADAVDRRVGDLREELLEVVVEEAGAGRERRERCVVSHRAHRFDAVPRHRLEQRALVLEGIAECDLSCAQGVGIRRRQLRGGGKILQMHEMLVQPHAIRMLDRDGALDLLIADDAALLGVDQEHPSGLQPSLVHHILRRHIEHAGFGRHDDEVVLGDVVAGGPQAVPVEHRPDPLAVGEGDRGRPVPGLHETRVILVERLELRVHALVVRPRLGNQHHHGVRQRAPREHQQLQRVVEHRRVAAVRVDDRQDLRGVLAEQIRGEQRLARLHPVVVAAQRIDLAVVGEIAVRVRPVPARERVGAEAGMDQRERRFHGRVLEIGEVPGELLGEQHPLVDEGLVREARKVPVLRAVDGRGADLAVGALPDDVELALEFRFVAHAGAAPDEYLADERLAGARGLPERAVVHRHRAPAEDDLPFGLDDVLEDLDQPPPPRRIARQEYEPARILAGPREREQAVLPGDVLEIGVRHLDEDAGAVAGIRLAAARAPMIEVAQHLDGLLQDAMRLAALDVDDEAHAAGLVLEPRVVEPLLSRGKVRGTALRSRGHPGIARRGTPALMSHDWSASGCWKSGRTLPFAGVPIQRVGRAGGARKMSKDWRRIAALHPDAGDGVRAARARLSRRYKPDNIRLWHRVNGGAAIF